MALNRCVRPDTRERDRGDMTTPHVLVTRPHGPSSGRDALVAKLRDLGFAPSIFSPQVVQSVPLSKSDERAFVEFLREDSPCVAVLSPTAVFAFKEAVARASVPTHGIRFASQGPGTTRAVKECFGADSFFEASRSSAEEFVEELLRLSSCPRSLLIPQSAIGREVMGPLLREAGVSVLEVTTYTMATQRPPADEQESLRAVAAAGGFILFMSPSALQATVETVDRREDLDRLRVVSIGPTTSKAAQAFGVVVAAEASESTEEGVLRALQRAAALR